MKKRPVGLWEETHPKISVRLTADQNQQMEKLARHARLKTSQVVARLVAYAIEKISAEKKRQEASRW